MKWTTQKEMKRHTLNKTMKQHKQNKTNSQNRSNAQNKTPNAQNKQTKQKLNGWLMTEDGWWWFVDGCSERVHDGPFIKVQYTIMQSVHKT